MGIRAASRAGSSLSLCLLILLVTPAWSQVVDYDIAVKLNPATHRLDAVETVRWTNTTSVPTDEIFLHLYLNAFSGPRTTFMRELGWRSLRGRVAREDEWGWTRVHRLATADGLDLLPVMEFVRPDDGNPDDFTLARIPLDVAVEPGASLELEIHFEAQLPWNVARTGYVDDFHLVGQWFPKIAVFNGEDGWNRHQFHASSEFFADFGDYHVAVTIPADWVVGATGVQVGEVPGDGDRTVTYRAARVHDFAWCTAPPNLMQVVESDFDPGRDVPMTWLAKAQDRLGLSAAELELPPMRIRFLVPTNQHHLIARMERAARLSVAWFGLHYGAYPYPQLTVVSPPRGAEEAGGMEYPTFITTGADLMDRFPPFSWSSDIEVVTVHEFGHQYFQGMLASNEFEEAWLDEGANSYAEILCMSDIVEDGLVPEIRGYSPWAGERLALGLQTVPLTVARNAWDHRNRWMYFLASYGKTAVVLRNVEGLIGTDAMFRGLRRYFEDFAFRHPTGRDLEVTLSEVGGYDLSRFFEQAIYSDAEPDWGVLAVRHRRPKRGGGMEWDGAEWRPVDRAADEDPTTWQVEVDLVRTGDFIGPVAVELTWGNGDAERRWWDDDARWTRWRIESEERLQQVVVDPDGVWVLESRRADNYWRDAPVRSDHPLWWVRETLGLIGRIFLRFS